MSDHAKLVKPLVWERGIVDYAKPMPGMKYVACSTKPHGCWAWWLDDAPSSTRTVERDEAHAKAAAQADYTARIFAALDPEVLAQWRDEAVQAEREACAKLRYFHPEGETMAQMRDHARSHPLYREGDLKLVWVNEGDLCNLAIRAMKGCTP